MRPNKFLIRSDQPFEPLIETARARLLEVDSGFQFRATARMEDLVARALGGTGSNKLMLSLSLVFGALSLLLAALGIYGAMSHAVSRRTSEFGIRMALGARRGDVLRIVLKQSLSLTLPGLLLGLAGAWAATRILTTLLFGITPTDLPTFLGVTLFLLIVAVAASLVPAIRASSVDPLAATRAE
jgi:ABC-type antimicrobial peptide transport system permease subunit